MSRCLLGWVRTKLHCFALLLWLGGCSTLSRAIPPYPEATRDVPGTPSIVFLSDTQSPLWFEKIWLKSDRNKIVPARIFGRIAQDSTVVAVFHLGDFTALGSLVSFWEDFDEKSAALREASIPIYPAFGNHEYMPVASRGRVNLVARFPFMTTSWYCRRVGNAAIVVLNSNFSRLTENDVKEQQRWYAALLTELDHDSTVAVTLVACHHSPYTNSKVVGESRDVQRLFLPAFLGAHKAKVFLSGHAHAFEHFRVSDKDFLVIGGGGGLLHPLLQGNKQRRPELFQGEAARSFFHYVRFSVGNDSLLLRIVRFRPDRSGFDTAYAFNVALAPHD